MFNSNTNINTKSSTTITITPTTINKTSNSKSNIFINQTNNSNPATITTTTTTSTTTSTNSQINRLNMAECALIKSSQCFQDKNRIKKDLTKLTKNLLLLVGLERVAQELVGGRRWRKLTAPFNSLEPEEIQDWSPSEICYFCNSDKHDSNHSEIVKHSDDCPLSTSSTTTTTTATTITTGIESSQLQPFNQSIQQQQPPPSCSCLPYNNNISNGSDLNIPVINVPINIPVVQATSATIRSATAMNNVTTTTTITTTSEQPLDLSLHSRSVLIPKESDKTPNHVSDQTSSSSSSSLLRIPHPNQTNTKLGKKNRLETTTANTTSSSSTTTSTTSNSNWKRAYTEEELQQALNDIQSGKLGTRRAAVIYGIPRSTLRNKVYKLSSDRVNVKRGQSTVSASSSSTPTAASTTTNNLTQGVAAFTSAKQLSASLPACAAVAAAAAAAAAAAVAAAAGQTPNNSNSSNNNNNNNNLIKSTTTTITGPTNFLSSGRKSITPIRNNNANKESLSSRNKMTTISRRSLKSQPVRSKLDDIETFDAGLSSILSKPSDSQQNNNNNNDNDDDDDDDNIDDEDKNKISSSLIQNDLKQFLKRTITQKAAKPFIPPGMDQFSLSADNNNNNSFTLNPNHKPENDIINNMLGPTNKMPNIFNDPLTTLQMLSSMDCGNTIGPLISQILLNVHAFPFANSVNNLINTNINNLNYTNKQPTENMDLNNSLSGTLPLLPELIHKLAQERLEMERSTGTTTTTTSNSDQGFERSIDESCDRNVILKVPSYQPKLNIDVGGQKKDDLIKTIKQEGQTNSNHSGIGLINSSFNISCPGGGVGITNLSSQSLGDFNINLVKDENNNFGLNDDKRFKLFPVNSDNESSSDALINENAKNYNFSRRKVEKRSNHNNNNNNNQTHSNKTSDQSAPSTPDPKRNRPKRGRYRNYKRDDLAKAVKAVQNGEMSVHRAGTHFGVPHSTLEYKVKERHLLRPKKRHTTTSTSSGSTATTAATAISLIKKEDGQSLIAPKTDLSTADPLVLSPGTRPLNPKSSGSSFLTLSNQDSTQYQSQSQQQQQQLQSMEAINQVNQASSLWQSALPLFPFDFGANQNSTNFFASNMMRKLKENAQLHEENFNCNNSSNGSTNANNVSGFSDLMGSTTTTTTTTTSTPPTTTGLKEREFGSLLLETLIKSSLERKMLNSMSSANSESDTRLNRNTSSTVPYRFHNED